MEDINFLYEGSCSHVEYLQEVLITYKRYGKPVVISPNIATFMMLTWDS